MSRGMAMIRFEWGRLHKRMQKDSGVYFCYVSSSYFMRTVNLSPLLLSGDSTLHTPQPLVPR